MTAENLSAPRPRQWRLLAGGVIVVAAIVYLIWSSTQGAGLFSLSIAELKARASTIYGQGVRVTGLVDGNSIRWDATQNSLEFILREDSEALPVRYKGARPDMFRDGAEAVVEGKYQSNGVFNATKLMLKCPSKYAASETQTAAD